jgi:quercetin dioxygenase-like cupin family protein
MKRWDINGLDLKPHAPHILSSTDDGRVIAIAIPAGESLADHQVHERAWVLILDGDAEITTPGGESVAGSPGTMLEFEPGERHAVHASTAVRLLLVLTPWPGAGHPGAMSLGDKLGVRERAAEQRRSG